MRISHEIRVAQPVATVWAFFEDVPQVAECLPGATLISDDGNGGYAGRVAVKLGPMSAAFEGTATVTRDAPARTGLIEGKGTDRRGGSRGTVKVRYALVADGPDATTVTVDADITLAGSAAQFGRGGLITEMSQRLIGEFVTCVEGKLAAATIEERQGIRAAEVHGISLFWTSLLAWLKRLLHSRTPQTPQTPP